MLVRSFQHNLEKNLLKCSWSADGEMISCGSSDNVVHIWDVPTTEELYHLPGHAGSVNEVGAWLRRIFPIRQTVV
jgi:Prp8 binding protein